MEGVVAYIEDEGGEIKLTFDDVSCRDGENPSTWNKEFLFTSASFDRDAISSLSLSKEQFAEIGENLIIRLLALNGKIQ
ncbi:hypothetical protein NBRC116494_24030 [Aurantivibrio plasticivorans]